jgi:hypothetical protein
LTTGAFLYVCNAQVLFSITPPALTMIYNLWQGAGGNILNTTNRRRENVTCAIPCHIHIMELTPEQIKLVNILEDYYGRSIAGDAALRLVTTADVFTKLQSLYPSENYTPEDTFIALQYCNFNTIESTEGTIKWLMTELK